MKPHRAAACFLVAMVPTIDGTAAAAPSEKPIDNASSIEFLNINRRIHDCSPPACQEYDELSRDAIKLHGDMVEQGRKSKVAEPGPILVLAENMAEMAIRAKMKLDARFWINIALGAARQSPSDFSNDIAALEEKLAKLGAGPEQKQRRDRNDRREAGSGAGPTFTNPRKSSIVVAVGLPLGAALNWSRRPYHQFFPADPESLLVEKKDDDIVSNNCRDIACAVDGSADQSRSFQLLPLFFGGIEASVAHVFEDREIFLAGAYHSAPYGVRGFYGGIGYAASSDPFEFLCWKPRLRIGGTLLVGSTNLSKVSPTSVKFNNNTLFASAGTELSSWIGPQLGARLELDLMFHRSIDFGIGVHPSFLVSSDTHISFWFPLVLRAEFDWSLKRSYGASEGAAQ